MGFFKNIKEFLHNITTQDHYAQYGDSSKKSAPASRNHSGHASQINLAQNASQASLSNANASGPARGPYKPGLRSKLQNDSQIELRDYNSSGHESVNIAELWDQIDAWLDREFPELGDDMSNGATANDLNAFEADLDVVLPYDVRESYLLRDGQVTMGKTRGLVYSYPLMDLESMASETGIWRKMLHLQEDHKLSGSKSAQKSCPPGFIQEVYYHANWIPIVKDNMGNNIGLDLAPGLKGQVGQMILFGREYDVKYVVADSFGEFLKDLYNALNGGNFEVTEDEELIYIDSKGEQVSYFDVLKANAIKRAKKLDVKFTLDEEPLVKDVDLIDSKRVKETVVVPVKKTEEEDVVDAADLPRENLISPVVPQEKVIEQPQQEVTPNIANNDSFVVEDNDSIASVQEEEPAVVEETVEEPAVVEETVEEPAVVADEEPAAVVEETAAVEEPAAVEAPAAVEEPVAAAEPVVAQQDETPVESTEPAATAEEETAPVEEAEPVAFEPATADAEVDASADAEAEAEADETAENLSESAETGEEAADEAPAPTPAASSSKKNKKKKGKKRK